MKITNVLVLIVLFSQTVFSQEGWSHQNDKEGRELITRNNPTTGSSSKVYGELQNIINLGFGKDELNRGRIQNIADEIFTYYAEVEQKD